MPGFLILIFCVLIVFVILQVFLSKKTNKWLGFILPLITFVCSLICVSNTRFISFQPKSLESLGHLVFIILFYNIPTIILLGVNFGYRARLKRTTHISFKLWFAFGLAIFVGLITILMGVLNEASSSVIISRTLISFCVFACIGYLLGLFVEKF